MKIPINSECISQIRNVLLSYVSQTPTLQLELKCGCNPKNIIFTHFIGIYKDMSSFAISSWRKFLLTPLNRFNRPKVRMMKTMKDDNNDWDKKEEIRTSYRRLSQQQGAGYMRMRLSVMQESVGFSLSQSLHVMCPYVYTTPKDHFLNTIFRSAL